MNPFFQKLQARWDAGARVCIGLDSDVDKLPEPFQGRDDILQQIPFNLEIVKATADLTLAYKPNIAFYPDDDRLRALHTTIDNIRFFAPDVPIILDAKRADIGNTNRGYVQELFDIFGADAGTVNPYFGEEAMKPFLERDDKGIIVLCRTSNPGAGEFQNLNVKVEEDGVTMIRPLYEQVARNVANKWNRRENCALVVGATAPEELARVRSLVRDMPILIPGIGTQGGDLEAAVKSGINSHKSGIIINSSSGIIFASKGADYAEATRKAAETLTKDIDRILAMI